MLKKWLVMLSVAILCGLPSLCFLAGHADDALLTPPHPAGVMRAVNQVPPTPQRLHIYVNDGAGLLTPDDQAALQDQLQALDEQGIAQVSVLVLPDTDRDLSEFAPEILTQWDIQHKGKKDGLLILVNAARVRANASGNRIFVTTGYALEEKLPDALIGRVLDSQAIPAFEVGAFSKGVAQATLTLAKILAGDKTLHARYSKPDMPFDPTILVFFFFLLFFLMLRYRRGPSLWLGGPFIGGGFGGGSNDDGFGGGFGGGGDAGGGGGAGR